MNDLDIKTITSIFGIIIGLGSFFYCKNEKFYLFVQRLLLKFRKLDKAFIDMKISLLVSIDEDIEKKLENVQIDNAKLNLISKNIKFNEIGNVREFHISISETEYNQKQILISSKYPIYSVDYDREFENFRQIHNSIKNVLNVISSNIDFILSFENKNPYESFFIKQMPSQTIEEFSIKFNIENVKIEAKKNKIIARSNDIDKLIYNISKILTFKTPIISKT